MGKSSEAACGVLAKDGLNGVSLSEVAMVAGIHRSGAYHYFTNREQLLKDTLGYVSNQLYRAVIGDRDQHEQRVEQVDIVEVTANPANFAMENPELCRI